MDERSVQQVMDLTGLDRRNADIALAMGGGDVEAAVNMHFVDGNLFDTLPPPVTGSSGTLEHDPYGSSKEHISALPDPTLSPLSQLQKGLSAKMIAEHQQKEMFDEMNAGRAQYESSQQGQHKRPDVFDEDGIRQADQAKRQRLVGGPDSGYINMGMYQHDSSIASRTAGRVARRNNNSSSSSSSSNNSRYRAHQSNSFQAGIATSEGGAILACDAYVNM